MSDLAVLQSTIEVLRQQLEQKDRQISELHLLLSQKLLPEPLPEPTRTPWWKFWARGRYPDPESRVRMGVG